MSISGSDTNFLTLQYAPSGELLLAKEFDAGGADIASTMQTDLWGNVYVQGTTTMGSSGYSTIKYSIFDRSFNIAIDSIDSIEYALNEMIIQVLPKLVDSNRVNDINKTFGAFSEWVKPEVIDSLNGLYSGVYQFGRMMAIRIFKGLKSDDLLTLTRSGDTISLPPFWSTFVLITPNSFNDKSEAEHIDTTLLNSISFAELNIIHNPDFDPNDSVFQAGKQSGLESTNTTDYDIEMSRAWDVQKGRSDIKVAVIDVGINWDHVDFNKTGAYTGASADSKVIGGHVYSGDYSNFNLYQPLTDHGTNVAGLIGAINNNGIGISAVGGGDDSLGNHGVSLVDMNVSKFDWIGSGIPKLETDFIAAAIMDAARQPLNDADARNGCHVINMSFGARVKSQLIEQLIIFAYNSECVNVASSGNNSKQVERYPASFSDRFVIKVGASDTSGFRKSNSNYGYDIDLIAPGQIGTIMTLAEKDTTYDSTFSSTSAAAP